MAKKLLLQTKETEPVLLQSPFRFSEKDQSPFADEKDQHDKKRLATGSFKSLPK